MERPTKEISLNLDQATALVMALSDSMIKIGYIADMPIEDFIEMNPMLTPLEAKETLDELKEIGVRNYDQMVQLVQPLNDLIKELNEDEQALLQGKIVGLDKKPLN